MSTNKKIFKKKIEIPQNLGPENPSSIPVSKDFVSALNANKNLEPKKPEEDDEKDEEDQKMLDNPILIMKRSDFFSSIDRETEQIKYLVNIFLLTLKYFSKETL